MTDKVDILDYLRMQLKLQQGMGEANPRLQGGKGGDPYKMRPDELAEFLTWNVTALNAELGEMLNEVGWKPWAENRYINGPAALKEMVDAFHFFLNILLALGAWDLAGPPDTAEFFDDYYKEKNAKNLQRQVDGYDGKKEKCEVCHRDLSEVSEPLQVKCHQTPGMRVNRKEPHLFCSQTCHESAHVQEGHHT